MDDTSKIFREALIANGMRPFDMNGIDPNLLEHQCLTAVHKRATNAIRGYRHDREKEIPEIHFGYADNPTLNAFAFQVPPKIDRGYIVMHTGMVFLIYDLFYRYLAHPNILPTTGNAAGESAQSPFCSEGLWEDYSALLNSRGVMVSGMKQVVPLTPERKKHAEALASYAIEFLVLHEVAHITLGHTRFIQTQQIAFLAELKARNSNNLDPMLSQALEIQADRQAAVCTWQIRLIGPTEQERLTRALLEKSNRIVAGNELLMFDWIFAVYGLFWLFGQVIDSANLETADHPPPPQRNSLAMASIHQFLKDKASKDEQDIFERACANAVHEAGMALINISNSALGKNMRAYVALEQCGTMIEHHRRVMDRWKQIILDVAKVQFERPAYV